MCFSKEFITKWNNEVKPQAKLCSKGFNLLWKLEYEKLNKDEILKIEQEFKDLNIKDKNSVWCIGNLIKVVDSAITENNLHLDFCNLTFYLKDYLNSESYWEKVWDNDFSTEEASNLKKLGNMMKELMKLRN